MNTKYSVIRLADKFFPVYRRGLMGDYHVFVRQGEPVSFPSEKTANKFLDYHTEQRLKDRRYA